MSSATKVESDAGKKVIAATSEKLIGDIRRLGMNQRQQHLNHLYSWYRTVAYGSRKIDWNGDECLDPIDHEVVSQAGFVPAGFYDAGSEYPLKFRKPTTPYNLVKVVVDRFTGLLFSENRHPQLRVPGDAQTEDFLKALCEASHFWTKWGIVRTYGGSTGTGVVGFQFVNGDPVIEVHDPRWCFPTFVERNSFTVKALEIRYMYPVEEQDETTEEWETIWYWYRRVLDDEDDILFEPVLVEADEKPRWRIARKVSHGLGFCPIVWVQNIPVQDDMDGDPDCHGIYEMVEAIDGLLAQANKGVLANSDPTVVIITDAPLSSIQKGSDNAIKLPIGSQAHYMEISGSGPTSAIELATRLRSFALEVSQCVLEHPQLDRRTATEIEHVYSSMLAKAGVLREQYGECGMKLLLDMMVKAARNLGTPRSDGNGSIVRQKLNLPPRLVQDPKTGETKLVPRTLGPGGYLQLKWPGFFEPSLTDAVSATQAAVNAKSGGLVDSEHASHFVSEYFKVDNVPEMLKRVEEEQRAADLYAISLDQKAGEMNGGGAEAGDAG